jgi:hypothetical protein
MTDSARTSDPVTVEAAISLEQSLRRSIGKIRPRSSDVIAFCCSECKNDPEIRGERGQTMGVAWHAETDDGPLWVWISTRRKFHEIGIGPDDWGDVHRLDANDPKMITMSCRVPRHKPRSRLPAWIIARATDRRARNRLYAHL